MENKLTSNNILPLIFVHKGFPLYFRIALEHACITQPNSRIIVLTNNVDYKKNISKEFQNQIEFYQIDDYFSLAKNFEPLYVHMSPNTKEFELICFERWFIILEFAKKHPEFSDFFCCDSDNLVYSDLTNIRDTRLNKRQISITNKMCPNCTYFTTNSLNDFCKYIETQYSNKNYFSRLESIYKEKQITNGGICDMTMFELYQADFPDSIHDFGTIQNGHVFDNQFTSFVGLNSEYITSHGKKKINFVKLNSIQTLNNNCLVPQGFVHNNTTKKIDTVIFDVLHFQGGAKIYMADYSFVNKQLRRRFNKENFSIKRIIKDLIPDFVRVLIRKLRNFTFKFN